MRYLAEKFLAILLLEHTLQQHLALYGSGAFFIGTDQISWITWRTVAKTSPTSDTLTADHIEENYMKTGIVYLLGFIFLMQAGLIHAGDPSGYEPARGSAERKEVLDSLRKEVQRLHKMEVIFIVKHLRLKNGWGWVIVEPQSPDGSNRYETILAAMKQTKSGWRVLEIPCTEVDNWNCVDAPKFPGMLESRHPGFPLEILHQAQ